MILRILGLTILATFALQAPAATLIVSNVRIVDTASGTVGAPQDVRIEDDTITAVGPAASMSEPGASRFEAAGRFLIPGLWDMHVHVNSPGKAERWMFPMFIAAGVTGVRDLAGDCWPKDCAANLHHMRRLQAKIDRGEILGPRIVAIGSAAVHGPKGVRDPRLRALAPTTAAHGRRVAKRVHERGADFLKPYDTIPRDVYFAMMKEARRLGLPVSGHVPLSVTTLEAIRAGQATIEHARHPLVDCSRYSRTFHEVFAAWAAGESGSIYTGFAGDKHIGSYYPFILATYDDAACGEIIAGMAASGTYYTPTLITRRFEARADEAAFLDDDRLALVPNDLLERWRADSGRYQKRFQSPAEKRSYVEFYEMGVQLVGRAHAAGVPILVGTDAGDSYCFPGSGLHDEMMELQRAGMSNAAVLRAATLTAAEFMRATERFGTVAPGKTADLVVLEANPLEDIANVRRISAVIQDGRLLDRKALDALVKLSRKSMERADTPSAK